MKKAQKILSALLIFTILSGCSSSSNKESHDEIKDIVDRYAGDYGYIKESDVIENLGDYFKKYAWEYDYYTFDEVVDEIKRDPLLYDLVPLEDTY